MVIRENDLPDVAVDILKRPHVYYDADELMAAASLEVSKTDDREKRQILPAQEQQIPANSPKRFEKLFHKKSLNKKRNLLPVKQANFEISKADYDSSSDLSLSDDSSSEWPFPYRSVRMRDRTQPGSSFWDSDTSIRTPPMRTIVPDVAASADSTMISLRSHLSSSSSDSCASVPCRLVAESQPQDDLDRPESPTSRFYTGWNSSMFQSCRYRRSPAPSYAHYLSLRKPAVAKSRAALSNLQRLSDLTTTKLNSNTLFKTSRNISSLITGSKPTESSEQSNTKSTFFSITPDEASVSSSNIVTSDNTSFLKETYT